MNILVVDVAAGYGGAETILKLYYERYKQDKENKYFFCVSVIELKETDNIKVIHMPWIKKSWFHRLYFEYIKAKIICKKYHIQKIVSLQNIFPKVNVEQKTLYLHQPLPFEEKRFSILENKVFWFYQNIMSKLIFKSVRSANQTIVQTKWMKEAVIQKCHVAENKIMIESPNPIKEQVFHFNSDTWQKKFIYPASPLSYKNHITIFRAVDMLVTNYQISDFQIILTLTEDIIPKECRKLYEKYKGNFKMVGQIPHDILMKKYAETVLLFPSYIETFGLPLLEAKMSNSPILASDCVFSREILEGYENKEFFKATDEQQLAQKMRKLILKYEEKSK